MTHFWPGETEREDEEIDKVGKKVGEKESELLEPMNLYMYSPIVNGEYFLVGFTKYTHTHTCQTEQQAHHRHHWKYFHAVNFDKFIY